MFCPDCGSNLADNAKFCSECGKSLADITKTEKPDNENTISSSAEKAYNSYKIEDDRTSGYQRNDRGPEPHVSESAGSSWYSQQKAEESSKYQPASTATRQSQQPYQPSYDMKLQQPQKKNNGLIIAIFCVIGLMIVGVFVWIFSSGVLGSFQKGYDTPEELVGIYFAAFQDEDEKTIQSLFFTDLVDYAILSGWEKSEIVEELDYYYDDYGNEISHWYVSDTYEYTYSDFVGYYEDLDLKSSDIESYIDFETTVLLNGPDIYEEYIFDFDLIKIKGKWHLLEVW